MWVHRYSRLKLLRAATWLVLFAGVALAQQSTTYPAASPSRETVATQPPAAASTSGAPQGQVACSKTISFAVAEGGQPVPAIPRFAAKWVGKAKHVEGYPDMCLSQIPSSQTVNYVVIFSTSTTSFEGLTPVAHTYSSMSPVSGDGPGSSSYGGTWSYSYRGTLPQGTTSTVALQKIDGVKKGLLVYAYNEQGRLLWHYAVDGDHNRENRLDQVLADIHRDVAEKPTQKRITAPLSVYYVNCDVDSPGPSSLIAAADPAPAVPEAKPASAPHPPPPPQATLVLVSTPSGADIYLDDKFVGKTPFTVTVAPGEHIVIMRKQDFSTWDRRLEVGPGPRRISAYLEQKFLTLPSSPQPTTAQPAQNRAPQSQASQRQAAAPRTAQSQAPQSQTAAPSGTVKPQ